MKPSRRASQHGRQAGKHRQEGQIVSADQPLLQF